MRAAETAQNRTTGVTVKNFGGLKNSRSEWPTWIIMASIYGGWLLVTWFYDVLPWWIAIPAGGWLIAWHGSFQHEAVHGHPTRIERLNAALASPPLALWLPYPIYRESHLAHHRTENLTNPVTDPESFYVSGTRWRRFGPAHRALLCVNNTVAGRLVAGPWITVASFLRREGRALLSGDMRHAGIWCRHLPACGLVLFWVSGVCGIPAMDYVLGFVWPGVALTLLRSFTEHRPAPNQDRRTAIVEAGPLLSLLYLNNNLHVVHHRQPDLPWHALPAAYRAECKALAALNGGFLYPGGYAEILRCYAFRPKDRPVFPPRPPRRSRNQPVFFP